jgi:hypothetical protein
LTIKKRSSKVSGLLKVHIGAAHYSHARLKLVIYIDVTNRVCSSMLLPSS